MVQELVVGILFLSAIAYLVYLFYKQGKGEPGCAGGCNACTTIDFDKIEARIKEKEGLTHH